MLGSKVQFALPTVKICGKHNGRVNSEIGYSSRPIVEISILKNLISKCRKNKTYCMQEIYKYRVTKPSYKTELRIMTSQTELLTLIFFFFDFSS